MTRKAFKPILPGMRFGMLTAKRVAVPASHGKHSRWECLCDCGKVAIIPAGHLKSGHTQSCGCKKRQYGFRDGATHGMSRTPLYKVWQAMKDRTSNPNNKFYGYYGGRGIAMSDEWADFSAFEKWASANGYKKGLDLDRINNDGNYCPENCRWIAHKLNLWNTRRKIEVEVGGKMIAVAQIAETYGAPYNVVYGLYKRGRSGDDIVRQLKERS